MNTNYYDYMKIKDLKAIIADLPDDMLIVMPVVDEDDVNRIYGFRKIRTAGLLSCDGEADGEKEVFCMNGASGNFDILDQIYFSGKDVSATKVLYGEIDKINKEELIR